MRTTPWETKKEDIGWLAGIIDGEGSIYASIRDTYPYLLSILNKHKRFQWYKREGFVPVETKRTAPIKG